MQIHTVDTTALGVENRSLSVPIYMTMGGAAFWANQNVDIGGVDGLVRLFSHRRVGCTAHKYKKTSRCDTPHSHCDADSVQRMHLHIHSHWPGRHRMTHAIKTTIPARLNTMIATAIVALFVGVSVTPSAMADNHANAAKASAFDASECSGKYALAPRCAMTIGIFPELSSIIRTLLIRETETYSG